jgi:hypothetical protein
MTMYAQAASCPGVAKKTKVGHFTTITAHPGLAAAAPHAMCGLVGESNEVHCVCAHPHVHGGAPDTRAWCGDLDCLNLQMYGAALQTPRHA